MIKTVAKGTEYTFNQKGFNVVVNANSGSRYHRLKVTVQHTITGAQFQVAVQSNTTHIDKITTGIRQYFKSVGQSPQVKFVRSDEF